VDLRRLHANVPQKLVEDCLCVSKWRRKGEGRYRFRLDGAPAGPFIAVFSLAQKKGFFLFAGHPRLVAAPGRELPFVWVRCPISPSLFPRKENLRLG